MGRPAPRTLILLLLLLAAASGRAAARGQPLAGGGTSTPSTTSGACMLLRAPDHGFGSFMLNMLHAMVGLAPVASAGACLAAAGCDAGEFLAASEPPRNRRPNPPPTSSADLARASLARWPVCRRCC
jgi:hypothetical protein